MKDFLVLLSTEQWLLVLSWAVCLATALYLFQKRSRFFGFALFGTACSLGLLFAGLFPHLFPWDEQFHALVAKNTGWNFLHPRLYPVDFFPEQHASWADSHTWLHKPPLFTWQMAVSVQLFGNTLLAARLPSVLLFGFLSLATYDIARLTFDRRAGLISSLFVVHAAYLLLLISGSQGTDHNDLAFVSYTTFSIWAFFRFLDSNLRKWVIWTGIFAGLAILTKWLAGLLVFLPFAIWTLNGLRKSDFSRRFGQFLRAFGLCLLVALPWHIYTFIRFPELAAAEMRLNGLHFSQAVENHTGDFSYYYDQLGDLFFSRFDFLLVLVLSLLLVSSRHFHNSRLGYLLLMIFFVFAFFSIAATKMPSFILPAFPFVLVIFGGGISTLASFLRRKALSVSVTVIATLIVMNWMLHIGLVNKRTGTGDKYQAAFHNEQRQLRAYIDRNSLDEPHSVIFGFNGTLYPFIAWMYYKDDIVYSFYPSAEKLGKLQKMGYKISLYAGETLPEELRDLPDVRYLPPFKPE